MIVFNDVVQFRVFTKLGDQTAINVRHYLCTSHTGTGATIAQAATSFNNLIATNWKTMIGLKATFRGTGAQKIWPLPLSLPALSNANQATGDSGDEPLPQQVCGYFNMKTAYGGRHQISRVYVPFPEEQDNDTLTFRPTAGYMTRLGAVAANFITPFTASAGANTSNLAPVVYHRATHGSDFILTATAKQLWATQRRRGSFGRTNESPI